MPKQVVMGAMTKCSMGIAPSSLVVIPTGPPATAGKLLAATIMDFKPLVNVVPFGMCKSLANPAVASATAAALGTLTPMPCIPVPTAPWSPGATKVTINKMPALHSGCKLMCSWAGVIEITNPGQQTVDVT